MKNNEAELLASIALTSPCLVVAVTPHQAAVATNTSRTRIFEAIRAGDLVAHKAGKLTIIEVDELRRWVRDLPVRDRTVAHKVGRKKAAA